MGAQKQKWTPDEEKALKAGVDKYGTGKWRAILLDSDFSQPLKARSNVDLKDKWRNISVTTLHGGSRKKAKLALKKKPNQDADNSTTRTVVDLSNGDDAGQQIDPLTNLALSSGDEAGPQIDPLTYLALSSGDEAGQQIDPLTYLALSNGDDAGQQIDPLTYLALSNGNDGGQLIDPLTNLALSSGGDAGQQIDPLTNLALSIGGDAGQQIDPLTNLALSNGDEARQQIDPVTNLPLPNGDEARQQIDPVTVVPLSNGNEAGQQNDPPFPLEVIGEPASRDPNELLTSVDEILLEAITSLDRPAGPDLKTILLYVKGFASLQSDVRRLVKTRLKHLINVGTIVKVKRRYNITPSYAAAVLEQSSRQSFLDGNKGNPPNPEENGVQNLTKFQMDQEILMIMGMSEDAAATAAKAVAVAEVAIAESEKAGRDADEAEAKAEAAELFATAAKQVLQRLMHG